MAVFYRLKVATCWIESNSNGLGYWKLEWVLRVADWSL
jgi:hypothetical protein